MIKTDITLKGRNVVLRPLTIEDAPSLSVAASESRKHYKFSPVPDGIGQAEAYIRNALHQKVKGERIPFTVIFNGRIVGTTSYASLSTWMWPDGSPLQRTAHPDVVEIGYTWLAHSAQRTSCNTEAKLLLLSHAFDTWQVHRVTLRTDERNERSRNAIERLGARFEGIRRADMPSIDGTVRNSAYYSIIIGEWTEVKAALMKHLER